MSNPAFNGSKSNMAHVCDACHAAPCTLYCHTDSTYLCSDCDGWIHSANSLASSDHRIWVCTPCENAPAAVTCKADAAYLCSNCDVEIHSVNALARCHYRIPISPISGTMLEPENGITGNTTVNEEIDEDEAYSWLLLEPDSNENQTNGRCTSREPFDDYMGLGDSCTEYQHQEKQYSQLQSSSFCQEETENDSVVPDQSFGVHKPTRQQDQTLYFSKEQEALKSASIIKPSSNQNVPISFVAASMIPNASGYSIPSSYLSFQNGIPDFFPNPPLLMPLQFTPMNREKKVLRYREKRKARKFEKKIRYASRKAYAETRPRVKGRFARKIGLEFDKDRLFSKAEYGYGYGYGVVPSL